MTIYRHKENKKLYTIEHLIYDIRFANCNAFAGVYADCYKHNGENFYFQSKNHKECTEFIEKTFEKVSEV